MSVRYVLVALVLLIAPAGNVLAGEETALEELVIKMAQNPEQHLALADYFQGKAVTARQEALKHRSMGRAYPAGKMNARQKIRKHCDQIVSG